MHDGARAGRRTGSAIAPRSWPATTAWSFARARRAEQRLRPAPRGAGVGAGDRVAVMMANRVEFVVAVHAVSKLGAAAVLLSPAWKAAEVGHALEPDRPGPRRGRRRRRRPAGRDCSGRPGHRPRRRLRRPIPSARSRRAGGDAGVDATDEAVLVFSSGTTGLPKAVRHTHRSIGRATAHWCSVLGLGPDDRFQVATPPSHILGLLNLLAAVSAGATVRLHRRFDLDEVLRRIEAERMTLEMAVAPIALAMANHPRPRGLRPVVAPLHHVGGDAGHRERGPGGDRAHRRALAARPTAPARCRSSPANPVDRPEAWRLDSAGLPPAGVELRVADLDSGDRPRARARSGRSRCGARR